MPAPAQQLSPAELAALEHAFATDPASDAYRRLTEAYLGMNRFMEAMVVCKKGVKAHPGDPSPRVLLARIYAAQGKDNKALEELVGAIGIAPEDAAAHRMAGLLQLKLGEKEPGIAALRKAWQIAPGDPETIDALKKWGLDFAPPAPPPLPAPPPTLTPAPPPVPTAAPTAIAAAPPAAPAPAPVAAPAPAAPSAATRPSPATATAAKLPLPAPTPPPVRNEAYSEALAEKYKTREYPLPGPAAKHRSRGRLYATVGLGAAFVLVLGGYFAISSMRKARAVEIDRLLKQTRELLEKDSYASYREAGKLCERILDLDPDSLGGHAYLAYVDAIRWGEHGESEGLKEEAKKHLAAVARSGHVHSHAYAAQAYLRFYGGDTLGALDELKKVMAGPEGESALLHGVLGVLEMQAGDLDAAREALSIARQVAPGDVRATQMLAEQWRRRGQGYEIQATILYDTVLTRLSPDHVPSLLGKAQILLDAGQAAQAGKLVQRVLDMGPGASPRQVGLAQALRGAVLHAQGKSAEGDAAEQQALALDPLNPDVHDLIGRRKLRGGDAAGAAEAFQKAIDLEPARLMFYVDLAHALLQRPGGTKQAVAALERASARVANARVTKLLGDAYRADGDLDRARATYEKAIAMEKHYPEARVALARTWRDRKEFGKALEELDRAVKEYEESAAGGAATAWAEIAETEEERGSPFAAVEKAYMSALKADPQSCPALFWLGRSRSVRYGAKYDRGLAKRMLSDYLRLCPKHQHAEEARRIVSALR
jgi:tetratricopeptide (TPR) repeat protein